MSADKLDYIDFKEVNKLLEGFNKSTGFVTAILDLEGNVLSKSGWRQICTEFHRINPETSKNCTISDTVLANKLDKDEKYHFYKCFNGLVDVAVPVVIKGEHVANLFTGQFFFEKPDRDFFIKQARKHGFDEQKYLEALDNVPVISKEKVKVAMDFLLDMTQLISAITLQKLEQSQLNESLKESEERLSKIFHLGPVARVLTRISDYVVQDINTAGERLFGYKREDVVGKVVGSFDFWLDAAERLQAMELLSKQGYLYGFEFQFKTTTGKTGWGNIYADTLEIKGEKYILSEFIDISDRRNAEEKVRELNDRISTATRASQVGIWDWDIQKNVLAWDDQMYALYGLKKEEFTGAYEAWVNGLHPDDREFSRNETQLAINGKKEYDTEFRVVWPGGTIHYIRAKGEVFRNETGEALRMVGINFDITQQKKDEEKIREKDLEFRKLSANVPDMIYQFTRKPDGSYCVPITSEGIRKIFGCTPEDVLDDFSPISRVIYPGDADRVIRDIENSAEKLIHFNSEFRVQIPGREIQWIYSNSTPELLPDGSITWYGFNVDITQKKLAEEALKESEEKFRKIFLTNADAISITRLEDERFVSVNNGFTQIFDYHEDEILFRTTLDIKMWNNSEDREKFVKELKINGYVENFETKLNTKNGKIIDGLISAAFIELDGVTHILSTTKDITKRKQTEEALYYNEALLREVGRIANVGGWDFDLATGSSTWTEEVARIHDLDPKTPASVSLSIHYYTEQSKPLIEKAFREAVENAVPYDLELEIISAKGNHKWVRTIGRPVVLDGKVIRVQGSFQDITHRKAAEDKIRKLNETLEERVEERTAQLKEANQELEAFSYSVSHDLRSPVRHINGFAAILTKQYSDQLTDDARKYLNTITDAAQKMGTLIDDLLSFSRTGRAELKKSTFKMNQVIDGALEQIKPSLKDRKIEWKISSLPDINADYNLLLMVWINLLDNAVKYTRKKEKTVIQIGCKEEAIESIFFIKDNGAGFDMQYVNKLFGVFQRLHSSSQFEGTGIGLANVRRIILRHGGRTWAEAKTDKGATFYFSIPKTMEDKR